MCIRDSSNIVIWTTTPWTIPGNRALAYGKELDYSLIVVEELEENSLVKKNDKLIFASELLESVTKEIGIKQFSTKKKFKGDNLSTCECEHPFKQLGYDFIVKPFHGDFVNLEQGTGVVHIAPGHGDDDYVLGIENNVDIIQTVQDDGKYNQHAVGFEGEHIYKVDHKIADKLEEFSKLLFKGTLRHSYPHSWRSKAPLIYRNTPQWFISMEKNNLRDIALKSIDETIFYPPQGQTRLRSMIETRPDWCVSRQRVWGVPLPLFVNKKTGQPLRLSLIHI